MTMSGPNAPPSSPFASGDGNTLPESLQPTVDALVALNDKALEGLLLTPMRHGKVMDIQLVFDADAAVETEAEGEQEVTEDSLEEARQIAEGVLIELHRIWHASPEDVYSERGRRYDVWSFTREDAKGKPTKLYVTESRPNSVDKRDPSYKRIKAHIKDTEPPQLARYRAMRTREMLHRRIEAAARNPQPERSGWFGEQRIPRK